MNNLYSLLEVICTIERNEAGTADGKLGDER